MDASPSRWARLATTTQGNALWTALQVLWSGPAPGLGVGRPGPQWTPPTVHLHLTPTHLQLVELDPHGVACVRVELNLGHWDEATVSPEAVGTWTLPLGPWCHATRGAGVVWELRSAGPAAVGSAGQAPARWVAEVGVPGGGRLQTEVTTAAVDPEAEESAVTDPATLDPAAVTFDVQVQLAACAWNATVAHLATAAPSEADVDLTVSSAGVHLVVHGPSGPESAPARWAAWLPASGPGVTPASVSPTRVHLTVSLQYLYQWTPPPHPAPDDSSSSTSTSTSWVHLQAKEAYPLFVTYPVGALGHRTLCVAPKV